MNSMAKKIVVAVSVLIMAYVATGYVRARASDDKAFHALTVYSEVLEHIQRDYVDDPNMHQVTSGALHGLLDSLDRNPLISVRSNTPTTRKRARTIRKPLPA